VSRNARKVKEKYPLQMKYDFPMLAFIFHELRLEGDVFIAALKIMNNNLQSNVQLAKSLYAFQLKEIAFTYSTLVRTPY